MPNDTNECSASASASSEDQLSSIKRYSSTATRLSAHLTALFDLCQPHSPHNEKKTVSKHQLTNALASLKLPCSPTLVDEIFNEAADAVDDTLTFDALMTYAARREREIRKTFHQLAGPGGKISKDSTKLRQSLANIGVQVDENMAAQFLSHLDLDGSGEVTLQEFERFVYLLPRVNVRAAFESWQLHTPLDLGQEPGLGIVTDTSGSRAGGLGADGRAPAAVVLISGAVAGVVSRTATAPLDRLKVLMQVGGVSGTSTVNRIGRRRGVVEGLQAIYKADGIAGFFQGNGANVVKIVPESAIKFWTYDAVKRFICRDFSAPTARERLLAGAAAGAASCIAIYPLEVAKTRMAVAAAGQYQGIIHCLQRTVAAEGVSALFKGLYASLIGIMPFAAVDLALFNSLKEHFARTNQREPDTLTLLGCGALSSTVASTFTYPLALVKTKLQAAGMPGLGNHYNGVLDCLRTTVQKDGMRGLYNGIVPNLLKAVPAISISYVVFETTKRSLSNQLSENGG